MSQIITISLTLEDYEFLMEQKKLGLKPSQVFRDALELVRDRIARNGNSDDWQNKRKLAIVTDEKYKMELYLKKKKLLDAYYEEQFEERQKTGVL